MDKKQLKNKRILVTGSEGYLGSRLIKLLQIQEADIFTLDRIGKNTDHHFVVDITDQEAVGKAIQKIRPQIIFHLAASLHRDRLFDKHDDVMRINYFGTVNLLKALQDQPYENFIFASSSEVYGNNKIPFKENQLPKPTSPYSLSKVCAEHAIITFSDVYKKNYTILRLFNFFGENMPANFFIPQMIEALKTGKNFEMTKGEQLRDFLYVDDIIQALILSASNSKSYRQIFNVCSGVGVSLQQLAKEIKSKMKSTSTILFGAIPYRENEVWKMIGSNQKISKVLGFKQAYPFKNAVKQLFINR